MKFVRLMMVASLLVGCGHTIVQQHQPYRAGQELEPGDRVIARWMDDMWPATVVTVEGKLVILAWDSPPPMTSYVPRIWVRAMHDSPGAKPGQWAFCEVAERWSICQVQSLRGSRLIVHMPDGTETELEKDEVMLPPSGLDRWAQRRGERLQARGGLARRLEVIVPDGAGKPVQVGAAVVARWTDGNWWQGIATEVQGENVTVTWADGSLPTVVNSGSVASLENRGTGLSVGKPALCLWETETLWWRSVVRSRQGSRLTVDYIDGRSQQVDQNNCIPASSTSSVSVAE